MCTEGSLPGSDLHQFGGLVLIRSFLCSWCGRITSGPMHRVVLFAHDNLIGFVVSQLSRFTIRPGGPSWSFLGRFILRDTVSTFCVSVWLLTIRVGAPMAPTKV